jgi:hypothetical protein
MRDQSPSAGGAYEKIQMLLKPTALCSEGEMRWKTQQHGSEISSHRPRKPLQSAAPYALMLRLPINLPAQR